MAYDKDVLYNQAIEAIKNDKDVVFISDIVASLGIANNTFFEYFPTKSDELKVIKRLLQENRIAIKKSLRKRWNDGENPTLQLSLYKLIATEKEKDALSMVKTKSDITTNGKEINTTPQLLNISTEELLKLANYDK